MTHATAYQSPLFTNDPRQQTKTQRNAIPLQEGRKEGRHGATIPTPLQDNQRPTTTAPRPPTPPHTAITKDIARDPTNRGTRCEKIKTPKK